MDSREEKRKKQDDESSVWAVAVPEFSPFAIGKKKSYQRKIINMLMEQDGFIGVYPIIGKATLCMYKTENDAKIARNQLNNEDCPTGKEIIEVYIKTKDMETCEKKVSERREGKT